MPARRFRKTIADKPAIRRRAQVAAARHHRHWHPTEPIKGRRQTKPAPTTHHQARRRKFGVSETPNHRTLRRGAPGGAGGGHAGLQIPRARPTRHSRAQSIGAQGRDGPIGHGLGLGTGRDAAHWNTSPTKTSRNANFHISSAHHPGVRFDLSVYPKLRAAPRTGERFRKIRICPRAPTRRVALATHQLPGMPIDPAP
jgi:hypothetical protein